MKAIHEMRVQQTWQQQQSAGPLPIILGAVIALGIGLLGMSGVIRTPTLLQAKTQLTAVAPCDAQPAATITIDATMRRLGMAMSAPLPKACLPDTRLGLGNAVDSSVCTECCNSDAGCRLGPP
jgi:hypothetical protein